MIVYLLQDYANCVILIKNAEFWLHPELFRRRMYG